MNGVLENYRIAEEAYKRLVGRNHFYLKDDLIQEAVIFLMSKREQYSAGKAAYETWAKRIATNFMVDILRKHKNHFRNPSMFEAVENDLTFEDILVAPQITAQNILDHHTMAKTIAPLFAHAKTERDRRIIAMHLKHYTQTEIARALGISQPYVSIIVERFRAAAAILLGVNRREYK